jgi:hypothetical protein
VQLHNLVEGVLDILGIDGRFALSGTGNNQIVGSPDFSWLRNPTKASKGCGTTSLFSVIANSHFRGTGAVQDKMGGAS